MKNQKVSQTYSTKYKVSSENHLIRDSSYMQDKASCSHHIGMDIKVASRSLWKTTKIVN